MSNNTRFDQYAPWIPPDVSDLTFQNCTLLALWVLRYFEDPDDLPYNTTAAVVLDGLKRYWEENRTSTRPNATERVIWASRGGYPLLHLQAFNYTTNNTDCRKEFCDRLPWEGNQDLAGRGMVANYFIQAIFVTVFMAFHMAARFGWKPARRTTPERILVAVQESTRPFLDSTLLFSIAVHVATFVTFLRGRALQQDTPTTAGVIGAYISLYTIFPPLILHSCAANHLRRKHGRKYIWSFLGALSLILMGLYYSDRGSAWLRAWKDWSKLSERREDLENSVGENDKNSDRQYHRLLQVGKDEDHQLKFESFCVTKLGARRANLAFTIILGIVFVTAAFTMVLLANVFRIPFLRSERRPLLRRVRRYKWIISAILSMQAMWVSVGIFYWFRLELNKHAGKINKDKEWSFGQVLAVATWAPVLMEFYVLWRDGAERGLTGLLSDRFVVIDTTEVDTKLSNPGDATGLPSDSEDQVDNHSTYSEPSNHDEQRERFMHRSQTVDINEEREKGPDRSQTVP